MAVAGTHLSGTCHCGAIRVALTLSKPAQDTYVRACQCSFCRRRGTRTIADPQGHATVTGEPDRLIRYRFGLKTADYLLCAACGTYIAAVQSDADRSIAVVNVGGLDIAEFRGRPGEPVTYDGETVEQRLVRRRTYWMPIDIARTART